MHSATITPASQAYTAIMSKQRRENMETELEKLRMVPSLHLFLPQLEVWVGRLHCSSYKRLADQISEKKNTMYSKTMAWIRCMYPFLLSPTICSDVHLRQPLNIPPSTQCQPWTECCREPALWLNSTKWTILFIHIFVQLLKVYQCLSSMLCCFISTMNNLTTSPVAQ